MELELLNNNIVDYNLSNLLCEFLKQINKKNQSHVNISLTEDLKIEFSKEKDKMPITILLWKNIINIYIGENSVHYLNDVFIENEKDLKDLKENLEHIFCYDIKEVISLNDKGFGYYSIDGTWKWEQNLKNDNRQNYCEKNYSSWM